jgi:hypothetical protein
VLVVLFAIAGVGLLVGAALFAGGSPAASPGAAGVSGSPGASTAAVAGGSAAPAGPGASGEPSAVPGSSPSAAPAGPSQLVLAVVADVRDPRLGISTATLAKEMKAGRVAVPCEVEGLALGGDPLAHDAAGCVKASKISAAVRAHKPALGLLPEALVTPRVKVLQLGGADLFGGPAVRAKPYPLTATGAALPTAWSAFDPAQVRTLVSLGETCPAIGVSYPASAVAKGWSWALDGGTAKYTGTHMDHRFAGPRGRGWQAVDAVGTGHAGVVGSLIADADITLDDFECPMTASFRQGGIGAGLAIDPRVAPLLARNGIDVVTLASDRMTGRGAGAIQETLALFKANGIRTFGAGMNLAQAMKPAVFDVRGVRFAFVGFNDIAGSTRAATSAPGVAWLTEANVRKAIAAARKVADVVVAVPQWGSPPYHADFTARQRQQLALFWDAGADQVIGHGTHWASAVSITKGRDGDRFAIASHGNFLYGQDWSRQTQEAVVVELTFVGPHLAQARLHPYVVLDRAQPSLTAPTTDGAFVQDQVWSKSTLP